MKIIFLNTWAGTRFELLIEFLKTQAPSTDIFCLSEVMSSPEPHESKGGRMTLYEDLQALAFPGWTKYFAAKQDNFDHAERVDYKITEGLAIFLKPALSVNSAGDFFILGSRNSLQGIDLLTMPVNLQYVRIPYNGSELTVINFHGLSEPGDKLDTSERLLQSKKLIEFMQGEKNAIVGGDFNLLPETESVRSFVRAGFRDLIKEWKISSTRSRSNIEKYSAHPQYFADFAFASPQLKVRNFEVPDLEISDHLPLIVDLG